MSPSNVPGGSSPTPTPRGQVRRERLLNAAASLVAERGFAAVGIAEIGAAAGVTGSAIYRHFKSKQDLLVSLLDRVVDQLLAGAESVVSVAASPEAALDQLIRAHVEFALRERAIIAVYDQEVLSLAPEDARRLRRKQRRYADRWVPVVGALRPDLSEPEVESAVHAVFGLLQSVAHFHGRTPDPRLATLLSAMAHGALTKPPTPEL